MPSTVQYKTNEQTPKSMHSSNPMLLTNKESNENREGIRNYYISKIDELQQLITQKTQNLRRHEAQRNELNSKGIINTRLYLS